MEYTNKRTKFKIMSITVKEAHQETERVRTNTDEDRKWQIQAAIVRIMKSRKQFRHNLLIEEVSGCVHLSPCLFAQNKGLYN